MAGVQKDSAHGRVVSWAPTHEPNTERLLLGIARTLNIPQQDIQLFDSFTDLGGDQTTAAKLEERMLRYGVQVSAKDILRCKTVAELQAHAKPAQPNNSSSDSNSDHSTDISEDSGVLPDRVFTPTKMKDEQPSGFPPPPSQDAKPAEDGVAPDTREQKSEKALGKEPANIQIDLDDTQELQQFLSSASRGEYFCLMKASAGPFEEQLVAFVSINNQSAGEAKGISLPPEREYRTIEARIKNFYTALQEWGGSVPWPDVWVPLHSMVTKSNGKPAMRALQWWLKNLDEDAEQRILSLQRLLSLQLFNLPSVDEAEEEPAQPEASELQSPTSTTPPSQQQQPEDAPKPESAPEQAVRSGSRGQPDIVVFKPEPIPEEEEPDEEIEIALQEAKAVPLTQKVAQPEVMDSTKGRPRSYSQADSLIIQHRLSTTRPDKTFSMFIEDESGRLEVHEHMDDTPDNVDFFPLSAMQQLFFRTSMNLNPKPDSITQQGYRFGQSILLRVKTDLEFTDIEKAMEELVARHSMLRARFRLTREGWAQVILPASRNVYQFGHHQTTLEEDIGEVVEKAHDSINPIKGPIFAAEHIRTADGDQYIFLAAHHLAVDLASWRVIIHDMDELLREGTLLSNPSIPFSNWIEYQGYETSHRLMQPKLPFEISPPSLGYWDLDLNENIYGNAHRYEFSLDPELTHTLRTACRNVFRTEPADVFLTALLLSFCQTFPDREAPTMWTQEHGRETQNEEFNIDETVGWFTSLCPISLMADQNMDLMELLKLMKDTRNAIPNSGIPFFNTEFLTPSAPFTTIPVEIMFNCVDKMHKLHRKDGVLEPIARPDRACESVASDIGADVGRISLFEVSVAIEDAEATVEALCIKPQRQDKIEQWMKQFESLVMVAIGKLKTMGPELTLADAPLLKTNYQGLSKLTQSGLEDLGVDNVGEIETIYPVNPSQQEVLIAQSLDADTFWVHAIYELTTMDAQPISQGKLCSAWGNVVASHLALRSVFIDSITEDGLFDQVVLKKVSPDMLFLDSERPVETLQDLPSLKATSGRPRHRLSICKSATQTFLRIDASQAVCDSIALDKLVTRLRVAYADEESAMSDNALLLQTWLYNATTADTAPSLQAWEGLLADTKPCNFPPLVAKPDEHQTPQSQFFGLGVTCQELQEFSSQRNIETPFVLQLAWGFVLRAFVGMDHVSFGYEISGRDDAQLPGIKNEIGSFAALSPCAIDLSPERTLSECLSSLSEVAAVARQGVNPTMAEVQHAKKLSTDDLFNTCLSMRDFDNARHKFPELDSKSFKTNMVTASRFSNCDLSLSSMFIADRLHVDFSYRRVTYAQAQNIINTFERATRLILDAPTTPISSVDLFTDRDYAQLSVQDTEFGLSGDKANSCVHQLILPHAQTHPEAPAICSWDGNMTYHQMAYCVATLATYLRNIGVMPGVPVPVVLEKSKWAPVIMLAVLKAGGSLLCLDASDRSMIETTVKQLNARIVVATDSAWNDIVCIVPNLVIVNERFFSILPPQVSIPVRDPTPDHGACIIYNPSKSRSGSSRSVFFTHASLCSTFLAQGPALKLGKDSRVLQLSNFSVDVALVEVLGTMVHGGCVCIPSSASRGNNIGQAMADMNVNWSYMTSNLARRVDPAKVPKLKTVCFRTRRLDQDTRKNWLPNRNILLAYGAPEVCPLGISIAEVKEVSGPTIIPQPLVGKFWILNPEDPKKLMPVGAVGELAIDCPLLTPHKFSPNQTVEAPPAVDAPPTRLRYLRTGHRVRHLDDGSVHFLSSMRDDVVIDGSRLSVSEIENHLRRCLDAEFDIVVESVVTSDSVRILAAFLELGNDPQKKSGELEKLRMKTKERRKLATALRRASTTNGQIQGLTPDHLPSVFIPLRQFPTSSSLKVNRRKLQKMVSVMTYSQLLGVSTMTNEEDVDVSEKPLPLTHVEERMRHVWAGVLDIPPNQIKSSDNFLRLGGNRFLAAKLVIAARRSSLTLPLKGIMKGDTLTELCQAMAASEISSTSSRVSHTRGSSSESFKIPGMDEKFVRDSIAPQMKVNRHDILDVADASTYQVHGLETRMYGKKGGIKCLVFNFNGPIRSQKLQTACDTLARLHPIFRTAFAIHDRRVYQVLLDSFKPEFQRYPCPAWCLGSVADNVIAEDQDMEFKPEEPATKFTFLDAGQQSTLIVRLSSSQVDESAVSLIVQDLAALYEGQGNVARKPNLFEYMRAAQEANNDAAIDFWKKKLDGAKMTQLASHSKPYEPVSDIKTLRQTIQIDSIAEYGLNFSTVLKAAWSIVLAQYAASSDVVFGEVTQGSHISLPEHFDLSLMIAPSVNITPVRVTFPDTQEAPLDFLRMVQEQRVAARPHEALGILELVQRCTDWPYWTQFSTVVQHRQAPPLDGSITLNMGDTTFTHSVIDSKIQNMPDIFVSTTMDGPQTVNFELQYAESRVPTSFAEDALRVLAIAVDMITSYDTIEKPMVQSSIEITRSPAKIPLPKSSSRPGSDNSKSYQSLPHDERQALQSLLSAVWTDILDPKSLGVPEDQVHKANFFDLWGSVLPAQAFADRINAEFVKQPIKGMHKLQITPAEIIDHPSMAAQYELIVRKMTDEGIVSNITRRKPVMSWAVNPHGQSPGSPDRKWRTGEQENGSLRRSAIGKLRGLQHTGSVRDLGSKAGGWMRRHRTVKSRDGDSPPGVKGVSIGEPVATELPPRAIELRNEMNDGGRASPIQNDGRASPAPQLLLRSNSPLPPLEPPELEVSPVSPSPRRPSGDSEYSNEPASPVSPLGPAWLAV